MRTASHVWKDHELCIKTETRWMFQSEMVSFQSGIVGDCCLSVCLFDIFSDFCNKHFGSL